jgi:UDP-2,3-diacylglucosamine hydrolase
MKKTAYFISDAHLGTHLKNCEQREKFLISFLNEIRDTASHIFIVGDLFDFWIEYKHAIRPVYFPILHELRYLIENETEIHYLAGNHDFALGPFLEKIIGIKIYSSHLDMKLQGKRIHLRHGDGVLKFEVAYRIWRALLRNPINQALYKLLHPNISVPFASLFSGSSRYFNSNKWTEKKKRGYLKAAQNYLNNGYDIVIFGHTHLPELFNWNGKIYCNTGAWLRKYSFAKLENEQLTLWKYLPDQAPVQIEPCSSKYGFSVS